MNMTRERCPNPGAYVRTWKRIIQAAKTNPEAYINDGANWFDTTAAYARRSWITALHNRINARAGLPRYYPDCAHESALRYDAEQLSRMKRGTCTRPGYRFATREFRKRYGHMSTDPNCFDLT
jgi:hypothetical protein